MGEVFAFEKAIVAKTDVQHGVVFGWAIECTRKGIDHFDLQGDHIPDPVMFDAAIDFAINSRIAKDMHTGEPVGVVPLLFPLTKELADVYGIRCEKTGLLIGMKPFNDTILKQYQSGARTGFSVGGLCTYELEDAA